jgi:hypothetical protein
MSWELDDKKQQGEKVDFVKLPEGITRVRIVDDAPYGRWTHWMPQFKRSVNCPGQGCPIDKIRAEQKAAGETPSYGIAKRFAIHVINRETGKLEILEQGKTFFEQLRDLNADEGDLRDYDIKIRRRGSGLDTSYRIDVSERAPLSDADKKLLDNKISFPDFFKPHSIEQINRLLAGETWEAVMSSAASADSDEEVVIS